LVNGRRIALPGRRPASREKPGEKNMANARAPDMQRRDQILRAAYEVACRAGIAGLTVRAVAAEAKVSHALVLFHFGRKERLVHEVLDELLEGAALLHLSEDIRRFPHARDRLHGMLQQEMERVSRQPDQVRLFLEYWILGARQPAIRTRLVEQLERYRTELRGIMAELLQADPTLFAGATADGMAAVALSWIHGCAVQALLDPESFDPEQYLAAVRVMIARFG
jgi:TetR/AcrR family transcriptional regulator, transcriptional repressor of bet genes